MINLPINNDPSDLVRSRHICYFTESQGDEILLYEVVEEYYKHPEAPNVAVIPVIVTHLVKSSQRVSREAAAIVLLEAAQNNMLGCQRGI